MLINIFRRQKTLFSVLWSHKTKLNLLKSIFPHTLLDTKISSSHLPSPQVILVLSISGNLKVKYSSYLPKYRFKSLPRHLNNCLLDCIKSLSCNNIAIQIRLFKVTAVSTNDKTTTIKEGLHYCWSAPIGPSQLPTFRTITMSTHELMAAQHSL